MMKKQLLLLIIFCLSTTISYTSGVGLVAPNWEISGQNVTHLDYYDSSSSNTSYQHKNWQPYSNINIQFQNVSDPFNFKKGYFSGVINRSKYRANKYGIVPEKFNFKQENGAFSVPYRLEVGDFYAFQTPRILQTSLKGCQIELQPNPLFGANQSLLLQIGSVAQDYLAKKWGNMFVGTSWMMNWEDTQLALNYVVNRQPSQNQIPSLYQYVWGMALNHNFSLLAQKLIIDAEWDFLRGERYRNPLVEHNKGQGHFIQIQGQNQIPITYNIRYENYDSDYTPKGSAVSGGRKSIEMRAGWQSKVGYSINGRAQFYKDGVGTGTITDTDVYGLGISGSVPNPWLKGVNGSLDIYRQHADSTNSETVINSINTNLSTTLPSGWNLRLSGSFQETDIKKGTGVNSSIQQYGINTGHNLSFLGLTGTANGGLSLNKKKQGGQSSEDYGFNFSSSLGVNSFRITSSYRYIVQQVPNLKDASTQNFNLGVEYLYGKNLFRVESGLDTNRPSSGTDSRDTRVLFTWTYNFESLLPIPKKKPVVVAEEIKPSEEEAPELIITTLADLSPGLQIKDLQTALAKKNIIGGVREGSNIIYETVWFEDVSQRQRLVLTERLGYLERATIIIDLNQTGGFETVEQLYNRIQAHLIESFGAPRTQEKGEFGPNIVSDLNNNNFIRISDWQTQYGVLRLGIPRRLDGKMRIEIQHATSFPLSAIALWGLEEVQ